jgi:glycosyltransferase involved in cell wall biosynthesis
LSAINILGPLLETESFSVFYASSKNNKIIRLLDMVLCVFKYAKRTEFVLIDTYSTQNFYYAFVISQLCRLFGLKYIPILHGGNLESRLKNNPKLSLLIFKHSKVNVAPSEYIKSTFETYGYSNIETIPNTLEIENYKFEVRRIESIKLLWVRSFSEIYNPQLAVKISKALIDKGEGAELYMVGPDSGDGSFKKVQELAKTLDVSVKFTGKLSKSEWISLSQDFNIFINTTNFDNMPISVIEAMALGLPIVTTDVGGMPYLVNHEKDGLLVPINDVEAFLKAILKLKFEPDFLKDSVQRARQKVESYDWQVVKYKWFQVLDA